jgi:drug/metabolite transporter (DMT)-like permease
MQALAILVALGSATCFGLSSALEQHAAKQESGPKTVDPGLLVRLLRRPLWLSGLVADAGGVVLQAVALRFGPLALVQPVLVGGLFLAIPMAALLSRRRPQARDFVAVAVGILGLVAFLVAAQPRAGVSEPSSLGWLGVAAGTVPVVAACVLVARRFRNSTRGVLLGIASGVLFAVTASLIKTLTGRFEADPLGVLTNWHLYALGVAGISAVVLNQNAFQSGRIAAPLTALTLLDPVVSVVIGVTAFHERLSTSGPRLVVLLAAVVAMAIGIWLAGRTRPQR